MADLVLVYRPELEGSYGYYHCTECDSGFFSGGEALHRKGCSRRGYAGLEYHLGPAAVQNILSRGERYGVNPIKASELCTALPEVCGG